MKTKNTISILSMSLLASLTAAAEEAPNPDVHGDPYIPVGRLIVNPTFVVTGVKPTLAWEIEYPTTFNDLALVGTSGEVLTSKEVQAEVVVLGVSVEDAEGRDDLPAALWVRTDGEGGQWQLVFSGTGAEVNSSRVVFSEWLESGTKFDLAARSQTASGMWSEVVWTVQPSQSLAHGSNGTPVPTAMKDVVIGELEGYTSTILSGDQSEIAAGPKDMVYFFELESGDPDASSFDLQDMVVVVQFHTLNNNGHGNNTDGVDVSNPGEGTGPNGGVDLSGEVDDEIGISESSGTIETDLRTSTTTE